MKFFKVIAALTVVLGLAISPLAAQAAHHGKKSAKPHYVKKHKAGKAKKVKKPLRAQKLSRAR